MMTYDEPHRAYDEYLRPESMDVAAAAKSMNEDELSEVPTLP